jgi:hypothetical protein
MAPGFGDPAIEPVCRVGIDIVGFSLRLDPRISSAGKPPTEFTAMLAGSFWYSWVGTASRSHQL